MPSSASKIENDDYFKNHSMAVRWPFSIYHEPIQASMQKFIELTASSGLATEMKVMVFGCGFFHEHWLFPESAEIYLVDNDSRVIDFVEQNAGKFRPHVKPLLCSSPDSLQDVPDGSLDLIMAKEVIEHIIEPSSYLKAFHRCLKPSGRLWVSTPNYGSWPLPAIEYTFLELIARLQGFSRFGIHPNKYSTEKLAKDLKLAGFQAIKVEKTPYSLALLGSGVPG